MHGWPILSVIQNAWMALLTVSLNAWMAFTNSEFECMDGLFDQLV